MSQNNEIFGSLLVGYDFNPKANAAVLIVGIKRPNEKVDIVNSFEGDEAKELYDKLTTKKGK